MLKNKFVQWFLVMAIAVNLPSMGVTGPGVQLLLVWALLWPTFAGHYVIFKFLKFHHFPTPIQLLKGFKRLWPAVRKGPVVTRVSRPRSSHTP